MATDSFLADKQRVADGLVTLSLAKLPQDFPLASCEKAFRFSLKRPYHHPRNLRAHGRSTLFHFSYRIEEFWGRRLLDEVTARARAQGFEHNLVVLMDGKDDDVEIRMNFLQPPDAFDSRHTRESDIHEDDVRQVF